MSDAPSTFVSPQNQLFARDKPGKSSITVKVEGASAARLPSSTKEDEQSKRKAGGCWGTWCLVLGAGVLALALALGITLFFVLGQGADDDAAIDDTSIAPLPGASGGAGLDGVRNVSAAFSQCAGAGQRSLADAALDDQYQGFTVASFGFNATGIDASTRCNVSQAIAEGARARLPAQGDGTPGGSATGSGRDVFVSLLGGEGDDSPGTSPAGILVYRPMVATMAVMVSSESDAVAVVETLGSEAAGRELVLGPIEEAPGLGVSATNATAVPPPAAVMEALRSANEDEEEDDAAVGEEAPGIGPVLLDLSPLRRQQASAVAAGTPLPSASSAPTPSMTPSTSPTPSNSPTPSVTASPSNSPTPSITATTSATPTPSSTSTASATPTSTPSTTSTASSTPTPSTTSTASSTPTPSTTNTASATPTPSSTSTVSSTPTPSSTSTASSTPTPSTTNTASSTPTPSSTSTASATPTSSVTASPSNSPTPSPTSSTTPSNSPTPSITPSGTPTPSATPQSWGYLQHTSNPGRFIPYEFTPMGDEMFFRATDIDSNVETGLYSWDESNGIQLRMDVTTGGSIPQYFTPWGEDRLVYWSTVQEAGQSVSRIVVYNINSDSVYVVPGTNGVGYDMLASGTDLLLDEAGGRVLFFGKPEGYTDVGAVHRWQFGAYFLYSNMTVSRVFDMSPYMHTAAWQRREGFMTMFQGDCYVALSGDTQSVVRVKAGTHDVDVIYDSGRARSNLIMFRPLFEFNGKLYMVDWSNTDYKIHSYTGSGTATRLLPPSGGAADTLRTISKPTVHDGKVYFMGYDGSSWNLYTYDGATTVTAVSGTGGVDGNYKYPRFPIMDGELYFPKRPAYFELWRVSASTGSAYLVLDYTGTGGNWFGLEWMMPFKGYMWHITSVSSTEAMAWWYKLD